MRAEPVQLACERALWRTCAPLGSARVDPTPAGARPTMDSRVRAGLIVLVFAVVIAPTAVVASQLSKESGDLSIGLLIIGPAVGLLLLGFVLLGHVWGTAWWANGAGEPVVQVTDGVVRARLSTARRHAPAYEGWDLELPLDQIDNPRVTQGGALAFDVPPAVRDDLRADARTSAHARHWDNSIDTPAAWPARAMLRGDDAPARLDALVSQLAGTTHEGRSS